MKYSELADSVATEVKDEYTLAVKKAVVDFVLGDSLHKPNILVDNTSSERVYLKTIAVKYKHRSLKQPCFMQTIRFMINAFSST